MVICPGTGTCSFSCGRYCVPSSATLYAPSKKPPPPSSPLHTGSRMTDTPELHTRLLADVIALDSPYPRF